MYTVFRTIAAGYRHKESCNLSVDSFQHFLSQLTTTLLGLDYMKGCFFRLHKYLTIIPQVRMGYESIAHEAEGRMGY